MASSSFPDPTTSPASRASAPDGRPALARPWEGWRSASLPARRRRHEPSPSWPPPARQPPHSRRPRPLAKPTEAPSRRREACRGAEAGRGRQADGCASRPGACSVATTAPAAIKKGGVLVIAATSTPSGWTRRLTAFSSVAIYEHMYSSLATLDYATNKVKPDLAESWKNVEPNVVEFKLRQGVKFHSGREVTAEDVKYTFDRLWTKARRAAASYLGPGSRPRSSTSTPCASRTTTSSRRW